MKSLVLSSIVLVASFSTLAAEFTIKSGVTDWTQPSSYDPEGTPGSDDTIVLAADATYEVDVGSASFTTLNYVSRIKPAGGSKLILVVDSDTTLNCAFNVNGESNGGGTTGELVKRGSACLTLGSQKRISGTDGNAYDYCAKISLEEGSMALVAESFASGWSRYGAVTTEPGTTLYVTTGSIVTWASFVSLKCDGDMVNGSASSTRIVSVSGDESRIGGTISGRIRFWNYGKVSYGATDSTFTGGVTADGGSVCSATKFGLKSDDSSSLGISGDLIAYGNGGFRFLGSSDKTDKTFYVYSHEAFLDGGPNGGLDFAGVLYSAMASASMRGQHHLCLDGDGTASENVFSGTVIGQDATDTTPTADYSFYFTKRGAGTWLLSGFKNGGRAGYNGGLAVEEGTLRFDSILNAGRDCALGTSLKLTDGQTGLWSEDHMVDYAIALGSTNSVSSSPVFEYTGTGPALCSTRPIALVGAGGTIKADNGRIDFSGVSSRDENATPTLTLDGSSTAGNVIREVADGAAGAKVNLVKKGEGAWSVGGNLAISGRVSVEEGSLALTTSVNPKKPLYQDYKWFRLTFAEVTNGAGGVSATVNIRRISLLDKDGNCQNALLTLADGSFYVKGAYRYVNSVSPASGEVAFDSMMADRAIYGEGPESITNAFWQSKGASAVYMVQDSGKTIAVNSPANWFSIIMHLRDEANPITHFDIQGFYNTPQSIPTRFKIEGSLDGLDWKELWSNVDSGDALVPNITGWNQWISDGAGANDDPSNRPLGKGFTLSASGDSIVKDPFKWFRLSFAEIDYGGYSDLDIRQIALYDKDGNRQGSGLTLAEDTTPVRNVIRRISSAEIAEGEVGYDASVSGYCVKPCADAEGVDIDLPAPFNDALGSGGGRYTVEWFDPAGNKLCPAAGKPETWISFVMHLPEDANTVTHFDILALYYSGTRRHLPTRMKMEGSIDGVNWTEVWSNVEGEAYSTTLTGWNQWMSDGASSGASRAEGTGFKFSKLYPDDPASVEKSIGGAVAVADGAALSTDCGTVISSLEVDANGAGTITGFAFAETGTLNVVNPTSSLGTLPGAYVDCSGLNNLSNWSLRFNGVQKYGCKIAIVDGKVVLVHKGLSILLR